MSRGASLAKLGGWRGGGRAQGWSGGRRAHGTQLRSAQLWSNARRGSVHVVGEGCDGALEQACIHSEGYESCAGLGEVRVSAWEIDARAAHVETKLAFLERKHANLAQSYLLSQGLGLGFRV